MSGYVMILRNTALIIALLVGSACFVVSVQIQAARAILSTPPIPSYEPQQVNGTTTVTVTPEQAASWRGLFTVSTDSVLTNRHESLRSVFGTHSGLITERTPGYRTYKYNPVSIFNWTGTLSGTFTSEAQEPELEIKDGRAITFTAPQDGVKLDRYHSTLAIIEALQNSNYTVPLVVYTTLPKTKLTDLNNLGITELIGRGESKFNGSPKNRRHNIKIGVEKMTGIIVKPGDEFSFNTYLGPVEAETGFLPELVIKKTGTVPEFGGGLCQVSSTTFRAAMNAGLPITQRRNHSYAVQYYAPQGTDATIYPGVIDLKFKNDTGSSILIWPYFKDENHLVFDLYGTYDGRTVQLDKPVQFDRKSDGSMKAYWTRSVTYTNGEKNDDTFNSVYQPPALFHKQEEFVPNPATPPVAPEQTTPPATTPPSAPTNST